jgi:non-homologous end joining protein Ku
LRQQLVDEVTREPVSPEDKGRGYEIAKGQYLQVEEEELEAIQVASTRDSQDRHSCQSAQL